MKYNFDREVDRKNTYDMKWNAAMVKSYLPLEIKDDMIPMWIADTDFACPPVIVEALKNRVEKEIYGYCAPQKPYYDAINYWYTSNYQTEIEPKEVTFLPSVVAGINIAIRGFSNVGDGVIIQSPVYDPFASIVKRCERVVANNPLIKTDTSFEINFSKLEELAKKPENKVMILCSPHNPVGRVWKKEELIKIVEICGENNVVLISDEIHSDIIYGDYKHYPILSVEEKYHQNIIMLSAPSKSFNIPGLKTAYSIIKNPELKAVFDKTMLSLNLDIKNTFGVEGIIAAYTPEGKEWLNQQIAYLEENINIVEEYLKSNLPQIKIIKPQGTFLCWLDCSGINVEENKFIFGLASKAGVVCVPGSWFGSGGENYLRLNIGCTKKNLILALDRIKEFIDSLNK